MYYLKNINLRGLTLIHFQALHKASLDIDEKGTTAAAVTTVDFRPMSYNPMDTLSFDHPFMIFITDQKMTTSSSLVKLSIQRKNSNVTFKMS